MKPGQVVDCRLKCPICDAALVATGSAAPTGKFIENSQGRICEVRERLYAACPRDPSHTGLVPLTVGVG